MSADWSDNLSVGSPSAPQKPPRKRPLTQVTFFVIILATLPCYVIGAVLLAIAPQKESRSGSSGSATASVPALGLTMGTILHTATISGSPTDDSGLISTPGQFLTPIKATPTPVFTLTSPPTMTPPPGVTLPPPTVTPTLPTNTPAPIVPTDTSVPVVPTDTPPPAPTSTPLPPTDTPPPTNTPPPAPTDPPPPTTDPGAATTP